MAFSNSILAGDTLVREAIESENFDPGIAGWRIERDGDAEFQDATIRGNITATSLTASDTDSDAAVVIDPSVFSSNNALIELHNQFSSIETVPGGLVTFATGIAGSTRQLAVALRGPSVNGQSIPQLTMWSASEDGSISGYVDTFRIEASGMRAGQNENSGTEDVGNTTYQPEGFFTCKTFTAPPSGAATITVSARMELEATGGVTRRQLFCSYEVREGNVCGSGTPVLSPDDNRAAELGIGGANNNRIAGTSENTYLLTGLTPFTEYNVKTHNRINFAADTAIRAIHFRRLIVRPEM